MWAIPYLCLLLSFMLFLGFFPNRCYFTVSQIKLQTEIRKWRCSSIDFYHHWDENQRVRNFQFLQFTIFRSKYTINNEQFNSRWFQSSKIKWRKFGTTYSLILSSHARPISIEFRKQTDRRVRSDAVWIRPIQHIITW